MVEAVLGEIYLNDCVMNPGSCLRNASCAVQMVWEKARNQLRQTLRESTFDTLVKGESCISPHLQSIDSGKRTSRWTITLKKIFNITKFYLQKNQKRGEACKTRIYISGRQIQPSQKRRLILLPDISHRSHQTGRLQSPFSPCRLYIDKNLTNIVWSLFLFFFALLPNENQWFNSTNFFNIKEQPLNCINRTLLILLNSLNC